jgi:hypothetical protein
MPSDKVMNKEYKLSFIVKKLLNIYGYKIKYSDKILSIKGNLFPVVISNKDLEGQKDYEEFYDKKLNKVIYDKDKQTMKIDLVDNINVDSMTKKLSQLRSKSEIIKLIQKKIKNFKPNKNTIKVSHLI